MSPARERKAKRGEMRRATGWETGRVGEEEKTERERERGRMEWRGRENEGGRRREEKREWRKHHTQEEEGRGGSAFCSQG